MATHRSRLNVTACVAVAGLYTGLLLSAAEQRKDMGRETFHIIPHTHWEGAVFLTREEYTREGLPRISEALKLLQKYPDYRFTLDQLCCVKSFLERYPQEEQAFRKFINEGRLAIVGGMVVMPDNNMPSGESFVRQVQCGKGYFREKLGVEVKDAWFLDSFGHHPQIPQLLKLAGYTSFWFSRGIGREEKNRLAEFYWEGLDGTRMATVWLPFGYTTAWGGAVPRTLPEYTRFFHSAFDAVAPWANGSGRVGLDGNDDAKPTENVLRYMSAFNSLPERRFNLAFSLPSDYMAAVDARSNRPTIKGDFNPVFPGGYSSRIELKQRMRENERLLTSAEKVGAMLSALGKRGGDGELLSAWEPTLFNQTHDLACGVMTDPVYEDTLAGYEQSRRRAEDALKTRMQTLASDIDTRGNGQAVVVWNTLGWLRRDVATAGVSYARGVAKAVAVVDADGKGIPSQIVTCQRHDDGSLANVEVAFKATDVPAMGYALYRLIPCQEASGRLTAVMPVVAAKEDGLENEYYRLKMDMRGGAIAELHVKKGDWQALSSPGNVVAKEEDRGDLWELYQSLFASPLPDSVRYALPKKEKSIFSDSPGEGASGLTRTGPVFSECEVARPFGEGHLRTCVRIYAGLRRIAIRTTLLNQEKFVRYRALFPTTIKAGRSVQEIPFGAVERPPLKECPAQNWADLSDGMRGVALLNRGLPGNNSVEGTLMLSLSRSVNLGSYNMGRCSDTGFGLGKELTFDYALVPHAGSWQGAGLSREGLEFNNPLLAQLVDSHPGALPKRWGLFTSSSPSVIVSAVLPAQDKEGIIVRLYESEGQLAKEVALVLNVPLLAAEEVTLMEDRLGGLDVADNKVIMDFRPFEIKTLRLRLRNGSAAPKGNGVRLLVEAAHPWTPPFGVGRVGRPREAVVELSKRASAELVSYREQQEIGRTQVTCAAGWSRFALAEEADEVALCMKRETGADSVEVARARIERPLLEAEAEARPAASVNPVDLGVILPSADELVLAGGGQAKVTCAMLNRSGSRVAALLRAWYDSEPGQHYQQDVSLASGIKSEATVAVGPCSKTRTRDVLHLALEDSRGKELWRKDIQTMIIPTPPQLPAFGAVELKLRYDKPIPLPDDRSMRYDEGWRESIKDTVVCLPNGGRFVFWRGAAYCPFWASAGNTGFSYQWAEGGGGEPLCDQELRFGRTEVVELTPARVHVRWHYLGLGHNYALTSDDEAVEDFYFYPDGIVNRVLALTCSPKGLYSLNDFITLTPVAGYPLELLPEKMVDMVWLDGEKAEFFHPFFAGQQKEAIKKVRERTQAMPPNRWSFSEPYEWKRFEDSPVYRIPFERNGRLAAIQYSARGGGPTAPCDFSSLFTPQYDRGALITPSYWGCHWPLNRAYFGASPGPARGRNVDTPAHQESIGTGITATEKESTPLPIRREKTEKLGRHGKNVALRRDCFVWLIGVSDASDDELRRMAQSYAKPAHIEAKGARRGEEAAYVYAQQERRAFCFTVEAAAQRVEFRVAPDTWCVNPVFELAQAPKQLCSVKLDGRELEPRRYAWDGKTLWVEASISKPSTFIVEFTATERK